jgi:hypothetical protein
LPHAGHSEISPAIRRSNFLFAWIPAGLRRIAEAGEPAGLAFTRTAGRMLRFRSFGALVLERWQTRLDLRMPVFHRRTQGSGWSIYSLRNRMKTLTESSH